MVEWQTIDLPLAVGVNTRDDDKIIGNNSLTVLENAVFDKGGALKKAPGAVRLGNATIDESTVSAGVALFKRKNELLLADGNNLYSYSESTQAWANRGSFTSYGVSAKDTAQSTEAQTLADTAVLLGIRVVAWEDSAGGVYYAAYDDESDAQLIAPTLLDADGTKPRVVSNTACIQIFYQDLGANEINVKRILPSALDDSVDEAVTALGFADVHSSGGYDAVSCTDFVVYAYRTTGNTIKCGVWLWTQEHGSVGSGFGSPITFGSDVSDSLLAVSYYDDALQHGKVSVVYPRMVMGVRSLDHATVTVGTLSLTSSISVLDSAAPNNISNITVCNTATGGVNTGYCFYEIYDSNPYERYVKYVTTAAATTTLIRHSGLGFHCFRHNNRTYVGIVHESNLQSTYFLVDSTGVVYGRTLPGIANGIPDEFLPKVTLSSGEAYTWAAVYKRRLKAADDSIYTQPGIKIVTFDFASDTANEFAEFGRCAYMTGGLLWQYDGANPVESGFLLYPENITKAESSGGSLTTTGVYSYRVYFEWVNAQGEREQSTTAAVVSHTLTGSHTKITLTIPTLAHTNKPGVRYAIYRTTNAGSVYYRCSSVDPSAASPNDYPENDRTVDTVTFVDTMSDTVLATKELDYLNSGELDNVAPPSPKAIRLLQDRLFIVSAEDPKKVYYSKLPKAETAAEFNDGLIYDAPEDVVALAEVNSQPVLLGRSTIHIIGGDGANNLGFGEYGRSELVTSDVGCTSPKTLVDTPIGWMFKSSKGIWVLQRNLSVANVGAGITRYNSVALSRAVLLQNVNQVRFFSASGTVLVYDYERNLWGTFTQRPAVSVISWNDTCVWLQADGYVLQESDSVFTIAGVRYKMSLTTAWFKPGSLQGYARARRVFLLGEYKSVHSIKLEVFYNYETFARDIINPAPATDFIETGTWGDDDTWGDSPYWGGSGKTRVYQLRRRLSRQKFESLKFRITELSGEGSQQSCELNALTLEIGIIGKGMRLPNNRSY